MKKIISVAFGAALFLVSAAPSFAANKAYVIDTGSTSINVAATLKLRRTELTNPQSASIVNNVSTSTNTGNNQVNRNTKVLGNVKTGSASADIGVLTDVNNSKTRVNGCGCDEYSKAKIDQTGYKSINVAVVLDAQSVQVDNVQSASVVNNVSSNSNSGNNQTNDNGTVDGGVKSGDASSLTMVTTYANTSHTVVGPVDPVDPVSP